MATQNPNNYSFTAGADLSAKQFLAVTISATRTVIAGGAAAGDGDGVLQNKPASGEFASVCMGGIGKAMAGGTISAGDPLTTEVTTGRLIAMSGAVYVKQIGTAIDDAVDGDVFAYAAMPPVQTRFAAS